MLYDLETVKARQQVRLAKENLRRWHRRFDGYRGQDQTRFIPEIKAAEDQLAEARTALRLLQDGRSARLPEAKSTETPTAPRQPAFGE